MNDSTSPAPEGVSVTHVSAAGTKTLQIDRGLALVIARGGPQAAERKELREELIRHARSREGRRCGYAGFAGPGCKGPALTVLACDEPGRPIINRCANHISAPPTGHLFLGLLTPTRGAVAASGIVREMLNSENAVAYRSLQALAAATMQPNVVKAINAVSDGDRDWFKQHHGRNAYLRATAPEERAESGVPADDTTLTVVEQRAPGVRFRMIVTHNKPVQTLLAYAQLSDADQERFAQAHVLCGRALRDPNLSHRAEAAFRDAYDMLKSAREGGAS